MATEDSNDKTWNLPDGKLLEQGPESCSDKELLAILIGTGYKGQSALDIADELMHRQVSIYGLMGKNLAEQAEIKGLKQAKLTRIAAAYEIARRLHIRLQRENR